MKNLIRRHTRTFRFRRLLQQRWDHFRQALADPLATVRADLRVVAERPVAPIKTKGQPDLVQLKGALARDILLALDRGTTHPAAALKSAHELAALDTRDESAFRAYLALVCHVHREALAKLSDCLKRYVVMHVSCLPRLDRAQSSSTSFKPAMGSELSQLTVVGTGFGELFEFDSERLILSVPVSDAYEHLPSKVTSALFFMALAGQTDCVLKVDDDHRLRSAEQLLRLFKAARGASPKQLGHLYFGDFHGSHNRAWHVGKSQDSAINSSAYAYLGARQWATGEAGYIVNAPAMILIVWAHTYFREHIKTSVYEDMLLSDLIERLGGTLKDAPMKTALSAVDHY